jgi:phage terminase small subunit
MLRFVEEFFVDYNASAAVRRAGYKVRGDNANRVASKLLNHPLVRIEIEKRKAERAKKTELTADYVLAKLVDVTEKTEKDADRLRALELLGRHLGLYRDRQEISGPDGEAIHYQKVTEDAAAFTSAIARLNERQREAGVVKLADTGTEG